MDGSGTLNAIELMVGLLGLAGLVAIVARPLRLPYTVALVVAGLVVGAVATVLGVPAIEVTPELVLIALLPGLVFEAAYRLRLDELRRWLGGLVLLAVPGVLISAAVVAIVLNLATGLRPDLAFLVGAMVSATDPAAVVATFKPLRVAPALSTMVDGESLLNDGTGLVLFAIAVQAVVLPTNPLDATLGFIGTVALSVAIGVATGWLATRLISLTDDHLLELTISVVLAYGSYLVADQFHLSGVIATVVAAVILGNFGPGRTMSVTGEDAIDTVWEFLAFLLTAVVFLLIGLAIPPAGLVASLGPIAWAVVGILIGRALVVYVLLGGVSRLAPLPGLAERVPTDWLHVLFWGGLRGAVAVAMALALPADVPQRALLQEITFGVVLFTLLVQGTTVGRLVARTSDAAPDARLAAAEQAPAVAGLGGRTAASTGPPQDAVDLLAVLPADGRPVEPLEVLEVLPTDLADRPAGVATEVEDAARGTPGWRSGRAEPVGLMHRGGRTRPRSDERPDVQSRETSSGGRGGGGDAGRASGAAFARRTGRRRRPRRARGSTRRHRLRAPGSPGRRRSGVARPGRR